MRKSTQKNEGKSLKTFFLYSVLVLLFILISLSIKAFFIIKSSKFDGTHRFTVAIAKEKNVVDIVSFDPPNTSSSVLQIKNNSVHLSSIGKQLAIPVDATIDTQSDFSFGNNASTLMKTALWHFNSIKTDLTLFDISRLFFLSKKSVEQNQTLQLPFKDQDVDKMMTKLFSDDIIAQESVSVEVVNATDVPGMGKRLARMLTNMGANVVSVSTAHSIEGQSKILFYGDTTYTLNKLHGLLKFSLEKLDKQTIANIVILVGEDSQNTGNF